MRSLHFRTRVPPSDSDMDSDSDVIFLGSCPTEIPSDFPFSDTESEHPLALMPRSPTQRSVQPRSRSYHAYNDNTSSSTDESDIIVVDCGSDADDEDAKSPPSIRLTSGSMRSSLVDFNSSPTSHRLPFSDPNSSIWKGRTSNIAVVLTAPPITHDGLADISASRLNSRSGQTGSVSTVSKTAKRNPSRPGKSNTSRFTMSPLTRAASKSKVLNVKEFRTRPPRNNKAPPKAKSHEMSDSSFEYDESESQESSVTSADDSNENEDSDTYEAPPKKKQKLTFTKTKVSKPSMKHSKSVFVRRAKATRGSGLAASDVMDEDEEQEPMTADAIPISDDGATKAYTLGEKFSDNYVVLDGIDRKSVPLENIERMFGDMTERALNLGLDTALQFFDDRPLRVATMCSGTEAPIIAFNLINERLDHAGSKHLLSTSHVFSAEIVATKQHFIQRNFDPPLLFRDVTELCEPIGEGGIRRATTAHGARAEVPGQVDILVTGTCCVDLSRLNNKQKTLEQKGESGDTFFAMLAYAKEARPKVIILENVATAPWTDAKVNKLRKESRNTATQSTGKKSSIESYLRSIDYSSIFLTADTKNYYLPHTRVRGYMICVDNKIPGIGHEADRLLNSSRTIFKALEHKASVPVDALLLHNDDPLLRASAENHNLVMAKKTDWISCKVGHEDYRRDLGLGKKRKMTLWSADGPTRNHDYFIPFTGQMERVSDTIEIAHLRNLRRGFDDRYYSRTLEVSQNVYRDTDTKKNGIIGCLFPHGMPWNTVRGGRIIGTESMILQGMPVERLDLSSLSQAHLQDLAGNAMSTTVVGAALLATLIPFHKYFAVKGRQKLSKPHIVPHLLGEQFLGPEVVSDQSVKSPISFHELSISASQAIRLCRCEGRNEVSRRDFQRCTVCRHTTCRTHGQNPKHQYEPIPLEELKLRTQPEDFVKKLRDSLPMSFSLSCDASCVREVQDDFRHYSALKGDDLEITLSTVENSLQSQLSFQKIVRSDIWQIFYDGPAAKALLTISSKGSYWHFYVKCPAQLHGDHAVRILLEKQPMARMTLNSCLSDSVVDGQWSYWVPEAHSFAATITSKGKPEESFLSSRGLAAHDGTSVYNRCDIEIDDYDDRYFDGDIRGEYNLFQSCGQAFNSLHTKIGGESEVPTFFYLEHEKPVGTQDDQSSFIFSRCNRRLDYGDNRNVIARVDKTWRQSLILPNKTAPRDSKSLTHISIDGYWKSPKSQNITFSEGNGRDIMYRHMSSELSRLQIPNCGTQQYLLTCYYKLKSTNDYFKSDQWILLSQANQAAFSLSFGWILERCKAIPSHRLGAIHGVDDWKPIREEPAGHCDQCAPKQPSMNWGFPKNAQAKKAGNALKQVAFEQPDEATHFEHRLKLRPSALSVFFRICQNSEIEIKIGFDPMTLCHRAAAILQRLSAPSTIRLSWWLATDATEGSNRGFPDFQLQNTLTQRRADQPLEKDSKYSLRIEQLRKLAWMEDQEKGVIFTEREFCESKIPELEYLLVGQASQQRRVRGGILADEVGFGKTLCAIGIIRSCCETDKVSAKNPVQGTIPTKASIIFVPTHLPKQWKSEADKFLGPSFQKQILVIEKINDLEKLTIKDIKDALIIIVSFTICSSPKYQLALAQFSGMVETNKNPGSRAKAAWYAMARDRIAENVEVLKAHPKTFAAHLKEQHQNSVADSRSMKLPVPSKRLVGASYVSHSDKKRKHSEFQEVDIQYCEKPEPRDLGLHKLSALKSGAYDKVSFPVFELFRFSRVVVDEFAYVEPTKNLTMMNVKANAYWALSGTPPLDTFSNIKHMAEFLRVNLGVHDFMNMEATEYAKTTSDMTTSEKMMTFQPAPSRPWLSLRHQQAQRFLDAFVRKDFSEIPLPALSYHIKLIYPTPLETALYAELEQRVVTHDFELKVSKSRTDMELYINDALEETDRGRVALLLRASYLQMLNAKRDVSKGSRSALEIIIDKRQEEFYKVLAKWYSQMEQAVSFTRHPAVQRSHRLVDYLSKLRSNDYGDADVMIACMKGLRTPDMSSDDAMDSDLGHGVNESFKAAVGQLGELSQLLVDLKRQLRFATSIQSARQVNSACHGCNVKLGRNDDCYILSDCGHIICTMKCAKSEMGHCPADGCRSDYQTSQKVPRHSLRKSGREEFATGSKLQEIVHIIKNIVPKDEQVLLFVQSQQLCKKISDTFDREKICFAALREKGDSAALLAQFQEGKKVTKYWKNRAKLVQRAAASAQTKSAAKARRLKQKSDATAKLSSKAKDKDDSENDDDEEVNVNSGADAISETEAGFESEDHSDTDADAPTDYDLGIYDDWDTVPDTFHKVLILNIGDASASGSNLTNASNIIFVAPYLTMGTDAQRVYDDARTQAIGRAHRYGQGKVVKIYDMVTNHTIDVDLIEKRSGGKILKAFKVPEPVNTEEKVRHELTIAEEGEESQFGSRLRYRIFPADRDDF